MRHDDDDDLHRRLQRASTPFGLPAPAERVVRIVRVWVFGLSCTYTPDYTVANANTHSHPHTGRILSTSCNIVTHNLTSPFMRTGSNHTSPNTHPHRRPRGRYTRTRIHALRIIRIYIYILLSLKCDLLFLPSFRTGITTIPTWKTSINYFTVNVLFINIRFFFNDKSITSAEHIRFRAYPRSWSIGRIVFRANGTQPHVIDISSCVSERVKTLLHIIWHHANPL